MSLTVKNELVNAAAAHLGEPGFETIDGDPPGAKLAKFLSQLDGPVGVERWALARHPWLCALSFAALSPSNDVPANWKWTQAFLLPASAVKLWAVEGDGVAYQVGTWVDPSTSAVRQVIWSNEPSLNIAFTEQKPFEAYSADLLNVMAFMLASRTAGPLKNDYDGAKRLKQEAADAIAVGETGEAGQFVDDDRLIPFNFANLRAQANV